MSSSLPNKPESKRSLLFHDALSIHLHNLDQLVCYIISMDPIIDFAKYVKQIYAFKIFYHKSHTLLSCAWYGTIPKVHNNYSKTATVASLTPCASTALGALATHRLFDEKKLH
jgi:hypothetical protein